MSRPGPGIPASAPRRVGLDAVVIDAKGTTMCMRERMNNNSSVATVKFMGQCGSIEPAADTWRTQLVCGDGDTVDRRRPLATVVQTVALTPVVFGSYLGAKPNPDKD